MNSVNTTLTKADQTSLAWAYERLEYPGFAAQLGRVAGEHVGLVMKLLPRHWHRKIQHSAENAIAQALELAVLNVRRNSGTSSADARYKGLAMASGALGGFFGGPALLLELPVTTTLMLSSIVDIARSHGEDVDSLETRMACMMVFALGGQRMGEAADTGYYSLRMALELPMLSASSYIAHQGAVAHSHTPVLVNLIRSLSERFGVVLSQKALAEIIPIIGAAGGALLNHVFIEHFQAMAHCHFTLRRLERKYGREPVRSAYLGIHQNRLTARRRRSISHTKTRRLSAPRPVAA